MRLEPVSSERSAPLGAIFAACALAAGALAAAWRALGLPVPHCPFRALTSMPCPTCGTTRLVDALLRGDVLEAAGWNPLAFACGVALLCWGVASAFMRTGGRSPSRVVATRREARVLGVAAVAAVLANWAWLIVRGA